MIRALWYMVKVGILVAATVWLADRPGTVGVDWMEYSVQMHTGIALVVLLGVILLAIFIYRVIAAIVGIPRAWRRYKQITSKEKGHRALALGLTAVAAGDARIAGYQAYRALKYLPDDKGMPLLLQAQAERLKGNEEKAQQIFAKMLENKDTAFLAIRGLLQGALDAKNYPRALELAQHGLLLYPKQKWVLRIVYDLEIRERKWDDARKTLLRAEKAKAVEREAARSDRVAMLMAEGEELLHSGLRGPAQQKFYAAHKMDPYFIPAVLALARLQKYDGHRKKAARLVERTWEKVPHAVLTDLWMEMKDTAKNNDALARLKWAGQLLQAHPSSADAHIAVAEAAVEAALWGEARDHLQKAEDIAADTRVFKLRAEIERRAFQDNSEALMWLKKAEKAPQPRGWICRETGRVYEEWHAIAEPHGSFNTIVWDFPEIHGHAALPYSPPAARDALLEKPQIFRN